MRVLDRRVNGAPRRLAMSIKNFREVGITCAMLGSPQLCRTGRSCARSVPFDPRVLQPQTLIAAGATRARASDQVFFFRKGGCGGAGPRSALPLKFVLVVHCVLCNGWLPGSPQGDWVFVRAGLVRDYETPAVIRG